MRTKIWILPIITLIMTFFVGISFVAATCSLNVKLVNQDPNPAVPGEYVKLLFQVAGLENAECSGAAVELKPEYPFSLDSSSKAVQTLAGGTYIQDSKTTWLVPYKLRVADDALEGDYRIKLGFNIGSQNMYSSNSEKYFDISVVDSQTTFDAVAQDVSGSQVSIGIVNTGKNTANSLIVTIPKQENFRQIGTTGQIVGNLAAGDYSIVTFNVASQNPRNFTGFNNTQNFTNKERDTLKIKIDYTDGISKRRSIIKEVEVGNLQPTNSSFMGKNGFNNATNSTATPTWIYIIAGIILTVLAIIGYKKYSKYIKRHSKEVPDWVSAERKKK